jgi:arginyl-tRNA synthetase
VFHRIEKQLEQSVSTHLKERHGLELPIVLEQPRQASFGEVALPIAFQLARHWRKAPGAIAAELARELPLVAGVARYEPAGNGYINVRFHRGWYGRALVAGLPAGKQTEAAAGKMIVEHTNINPNKAAHIGHLRNAVLGDTFVRMLRALGRQVEVQNYIDNTGVQVADVVAGFHFLEQKTPRQVAELIAGHDRFDYYCWDLYARISAHFQGNPEALKWRHQALHAIEAGEGVLAELGHLVADAVMQAHLRTMLRLGIQYDVLARESEILHLKFWATAFELLKQRGAIVFETEGKNAGCWVMPAAALAAGAAEGEGKIIVRSDGTVTYVGKDIAYQLWKFGLLGKDFYYRPLLTYPDGRKLWITSGKPSEEPAPSFGGGQWVYNVIDSRQSYLQEVVAAGLRALGFEEQARRSVHFAYEIVALSPRTCAELGIALSEEDRQRAWVEVSGRKGLGVKADDLIDKLIERARCEVDERHPAAPAEERARVAEQIAVGALRYFMLKYTRTSVIAFDLQEALSFEGETGPYVQYAAVRARNILRKLESRGEPLPDFAAVLDEASMARQLAEEDFWQLVLTISKADHALERAVESGEPAHVAKYAFQLAQAFNNFYHEYPVLDEPDPERRTFLLWLTSYFRSQLAGTLDILGIPVPDYM